MLDALLLVFEPSTVTSGTWTLNASDGWLTFNQGGSFFDVSGTITSQAVSLIDLAEIAITSAAHVARVDAPDDAFRLEDVPGVAVRFEHARGDKCARCWMILEEVGKNASYPDLCNRCSEAVATPEKA